MILLDANVLIYALDETAEHHNDCRQVVDLATTARMPAVLVPQVLLECYGVITSPRRVANPLSMRAAVEAVRPIWQALPVMTVRPESIASFEALAVRARRQGKRLYDLFLIAQMVTNAIHEICTVNVRDFRASDITALPPAAVLARYA